MKRTRELHSVLAMHAECKDACVLVLCILLGDLVLNGLHDILQSQWVVLSQLLTRAYDDCQYTPSHAKSKAYFAESSARARHPFP